MSEEPHRENPLLFVLMGVSGSGKSSIGRELAHRLGLRFFEGDDYHPRENVAKMSAGIPLTDTDRQPWIAAIARAVNESAAEDAVLACSALTKAVRQQLTADVQRTCVLFHLRGDPEVIRQRMMARAGHFMRSNMLHSQLATLEQPDDAITIDIGRPLEEVVDEVVSAVAAIRRGDEAGKA